jgi:hypothetical protein
MLSTVPRNGDATHAIRITGLDCMPCHCGAPSGIARLGLAFIFQII